MKILKSIGLYFVYPFVMFVLGIYTHILYLDFFYPNKYHQTKEEVVLDADTYPVSSISKMITTVDTNYIVVEENDITGEIKTFQTLIPHHYTGMSRSDLEKALEDSLQETTSDDVKKEIIDIQLESFSSKEVKVRKIYRFLDENTGYYLMVQDGKIVVMEKDKKTVYLTTDIYVEALSDLLKQELIRGKYINNIEELYGFLESYTS